MMDWPSLAWFVAGGLIGGVIGIACTIWAVNYTFGRMYPARRETGAYDKVARPDESAAQGAEAKTAHSGFPLHD